MLGRLFKKAVASRPLDSARVPDGVDEAERQRKLAFSNKRLRMPPAYDARGLGGDQRIGASRPAGALMRARLQANIESRTGRFCSGLLQRHCLGVRTAAGLGPAAPNDDVVFDDNAANRRIISSLPLAAFGKRDRGS